MSKGKGFHTHHLVRALKGGSGVRIKRGGVKLIMWAPHAGRYVFEERTPEGEKPQIEVLALQLVSDEQDGRTSELPAEAMSPRPDTHCPVAELKWGRFAELKRGRSIEIKFPAGEELKVSVKNPCYSVFLFFEQTGAEGEWPQIKIVAA